MIIFDLGSEERQQLKELKRCVYNNLDEGVTDNKYV